MKVALFAAYYGESHRQWADGLAKHSHHHIDLYTMAGRHWKWRMHGAAVYFAANAMKEQPPERIIVTDMLDVAAFRGLLPPSWREVPLLLYMHENQLTYPWSATDRDVDKRRDRHYGWINYTSMLAADRIAFNSQYHLDAVVAALPAYLAAFPDYQTRARVQEVVDASRVLHLGMDYSPRLPRVTNDRPVVLWNHRWEYDKNPYDWYEIIRRVIAKHDIELIVCGKAYRKMPAVFNTMQQEFSDRIIHWGYAETEASYQRLLARSDISLVTSRQDFFGIAVVEAIHQGVTPLLPLRLAYPDYVSPVEHSHLYYSSIDEAVERLTHLIIDASPRQQLDHLVAPFAWSQIIHSYDMWITNCR